MLNRRTFLGIMGATLVSPTILLGDDKKEELVADVVVTDDKILFINLELTRFGNRIPTLTGLFTQTGLDKFNLDLYYTRVSDIREVRNIVSNDPLHVTYTYFADVEATWLYRDYRPITIYGNNIDIFNIS